MENSADPDQLASYTVCKGRVYPGSAGQGLTLFPASGDFYHLLLTFANSLDQDQARQNAGPDLDPICLTL